MSAIKGAYRSSVQAVIHFVICRYEHAVVFFSQDKVPVIRIQAVLAVFRLQDRGDKNCRVTKSKGNFVYREVDAVFRNFAIFSLFQPCWNALKRIVAPMFVN